jgi:hypothetical protein
VKNAGQTSGATRVVVTDPLPAGTELVSARTNRGSGCTGTTTLTCDLDFLSGELVGEVEIVVRVTRPGTLVNTATVAAAERDPDASNNTASATVSVPAQEPSVPAALKGVTKRGSAGANVLRGTAFADVLYGLAGNDKLLGLAGNDRLYGGPGQDEVLGAAGNDTLNGGPGRDLLAAGAGSDALQSRDGTRDVLRCGTGRDTVLADKLDSVARDCEKVKR